MLISDCCLRPSPMSNDNGVRQISMQGVGGDVGGSGGCGGGDRSSICVVDEHASIALHQRQLDADTLVLLHSTRRRRGGMLAQQKKQPQPESPQPRQPTLAVTSITTFTSGRPTPPTTSTFKSSLQSSTSTTQVNKTITTSTSKHNKQKAPTNLYLYPPPQSRGTHFEYPQLATNDRFSTNNIYNANRFII